MTLGDFLKEINQLEWLMKYIKERYQNNIKRITAKMNEESLFYKERLSDFPSYDILVYKIKDLQEEYVNKKYIELNDFYQSFSTFKDYVYFLNLFDFDDDDLKDANEILKREIKKEDLKSAAWEIIEMALPFNFSIVEKYNKRELTSMFFLDNDLKHIINQLKKIEDIFNYRNEEFKVLLSFKLNNKEDCIFEMLKQNTSLSNYFTIIKNTSK